MIILTPTEIDAVARWIYAEVKARRRRMREIFLAIATARLDEDV